MRIPMPDVGQVRQVPATRGATVIDDFLDYNGHMNIGFYMELNSWAADDLCQAAGVDDAYRTEQHMGVFTLEHHIRYTAEMRLGEEMTLHPMVLSRSDRMAHMISFLVNDNGDRVSNSLEVLLAHVHLDTRQIVPFPEDIAAGFDKLIESQPKLAWEPPVCGVMAPR